MTEPAGRPSPLRLLAEVRTVAEFGAWVVAQPWLRRLARGDGHPVVVMPGFLAGDASTAPLRAYLRRLGYDAHGWGAGRNLGQPGQEDEAIDHLLGLARRHQARVSLIGWSLGGIYAREIARMLPARVRQVITLGSPFTGDHTANHAWWIYRRLSGRTSHELARMRPTLRRPPPVPCTSVYSRGDGVTAWECCRQGRGPRAENVEVPSSHLGYGHNPLVAYVIADRLAQPEGDWRPFAAEGLVGRLCRRRARAAAARRPRSAART